MNVAASTSRVLNPAERFAEIVFGLIMVLSFTCALSVAEAGREDVRAMWIGAIGCNLAWGLIDAVFYILACLAESGRNILMLGIVQKPGSADEARAMIKDQMPTRIAEALTNEDLDRIHAHLKTLPVSGERPRLSAKNLRGAIGVFLLVFASTFPVVLPFFFIHEAHLALRVSNGIAIMLLFAAGAMLGRYAGMRQVLTGLLMVLIGVGLVGITIALGG